MNLFSIIMFVLLTGRCDKIEKKWNDLVESVASYTRFTNYNYSSKKIYTNGAGLVSAFGKIFFCETSYWKHLMLVC